MTPQDIQAMEFSKAVFGGYDMAAVDDFLEKLTEDYTALYKDNAVLKGKIKVLVEKVEEYRSTEDAMRAALLTAQKMSDEMTEETRKQCEAKVADTTRQCEEMLAAATRDVEKYKAETEEYLSHENTKLDAARAKTGDFVAASRQIVEQYLSFLTKLEGVTSEYVAEESAVEAPAAPTMPEPPVTEPHVTEPAAAEPAAAEPAAEESAAPEPEPVREDEPEELNFKVDEETLRDVDSVVADIMREERDEEPQKPSFDLGGSTRRIDTDAVRRFYSGGGNARRLEWDDDDDDAASKPKFDFSDLKFGSNYNDD